jgi:flagellar basal body rod protein FlgG
MSDGIRGMSQALRSIMRMGETYAGNLSRSQVTGAQEARVSLTQEGGASGPSTALAVGETRRDLSQGPLAESSSPTDLALNGSGYFLLFNESGNLFLTRNGNFNFNSNGELVNGQGLFVASFDPGTNMINKTTKQTVSGSWSADDHVAFNGDGTMLNLSRGNTPGRQLALATVPNEQGMVASSSYPGVFTASEATGLLSTARSGENGMATIVPHALEQSNISASEQLINLSSFQGGFKATTAAMRALTQALDDVIAQFKPA